MSMSQQDKINNDNKTSAIRQLAATLSNTRKNQFRADYQQFKEDFSQETIKDTFAIETFMLLNKDLLQRGTRMFKARQYLECLLKYNQGMVAGSFMEKYSYTPDRMKGFIMQCICFDAAVILNLPSMEYDLKRGMLMDYTVQAQFTIEDSLAEEKSEKKVKDNLKKTRHVMVSDSSKGIIKKEKYSDKKEKHSRNKNKKDDTDIQLISPAQHKKYMEKKKAEHSRQEKLSFMAKPSVPVRWEDSLRAAEQIKEVKHGLSFDITSVIADKFDSHPQIDKDLVGQNSFFKFVSSQEPPTNVEYAELNHYQQRGNISQGVNQQNIPSQQQICELIDDAEQHRPQQYDGANMMNISLAHAELKRRNMQVGYQDDIAADFLLNQSNQSVGLDQDLLQEVINASVSNEQVSDTDRTVDNNAEIDADLDMEERQFYQAQKESAAQYHQLKSSLEQPAEFAEQEQFYQQNFVEQIQPSVSQWQQQAEQHLQPAAGEGKNDKKRKRPQHPSQMWKNRSEESKQQYYKKRNEKKATHTHLMTEALEATKRLEAQNTDLQIKLNYMQKQLTKISAKLYKNNMEHKQKRRERKQIRKGIVTRIQRMERGESPSDSEDEIQLVTMEEYKQKGFYSSSSDEELESNYQLMQKMEADWYNNKKQRRLQ